MRVIGAGAIDAALEEREPPPRDEYRQRPQIRKSRATMGVATAPIEHQNIKAFLPKHERARELVEKPLVTTGADASPQFARQLVTISLDIAAEERLLL